MRKHKEHRFFGKPRPKSQNVAQPVLKLKHVGWKLVGHGG